VKKAVIPGHDRVTYEYSEEEFKRLLGITDPEHVLQVSNPGYDPVIVILSSY
jgi:hypothetical protein